MESLSSYVPPVAKKAKEKAPYTWSWYVALFLASAATLIVLLAWISFVLAMEMQPIARTTTWNELMAPIILTISGVVPWLLVWRSKVFGFGRLLICITLIAGTCTGLFAFDYWLVHRDDFGDPSDYNKPWRSGGIEFSPGSNN